MENNTIQICTPWCLPLILYIAFSGINLHKMSNSPLYNIRQIMSNLAWNLVIAFVMYNLCGRCKQKWAWVIFLFPLILATILVIAILALVLAAPQQPKNNF